MSAEHYAKPAASTKNDSRLHLLPPAASKSMENRSLVMFLSQVEHSHSQGLLQRSTVGSKSIWFTYAGFPQVRHYKISRLFQITLKYFEAFRGAFYNRGGAIILRVNSTNITASEASRKKIWGVVPPHTTFWGYNSCKETYGEPVGQQVANNVTCHNKFPDHISNSLTFLGLPNSLTIPDYPDLWEPCHQSSTKLLRTAHAT